MVAALTERLPGVPAHLSSTLASMGSALPYGLAAELITVPARRRERVDEGFDDPAR